MDGVHIDIGEEKYDAKLVARNLKAIAEARTLVAIVVGLGAGIIGLTGFQGIFLFLAISISFGGVVLLLNMGNDW
eukprot:CAMPEP_0119122034 /NCGR_PEP_ID=MMETSP1310-20130426/2415_1 /TAXON_ID=464262 /ORGANISM="Genus nov. species nov., Strain RCC2339" /LENGTH=74 /DNA_ID=CAMNT_0007111639 /DNA_START=135 /DNA_END=356 /DNA_ORIENTATION=+